MNSGLFGVRNAKPDGNPKKQGRSETSLNMRCAVRVADSSHGIFHQKQTYPHVPPIAIISKSVDSICGLLLQQFSLVQRAELWQNV